MTLLPSKKTSLEESIHCLRVTGKKLRAFLELFSPALGRTEARKRMRDLSRIAKPLGRVRTADLLDKLLDQFHSKGLQQNSPAKPEDLKEDMKKASQALKNTKIFILTRGLAEISGDELFAKLRQSREQMCKMQERSEGRHRGKRLHEWRKSVKKYLYQADVLSALHPPKMGRTKHLKKTEDRLGKIHDLDDLRALLKASPLPSHRRKVLKQIAGKQRKLARHLFL